VPGMGAHGWVAGICPPYGSNSLYGLAGHSGSPWMSQATTCGSGYDVICRE